MKKIVAILLVAVLGAVSIITFAACEKNKDNVIVVGASDTPHAIVLEYVKDKLKDKGYELRVVVQTDYVFPNLALHQGNLDANYFQHRPYLEKFNLEHKTNIVPVANIHFEPLGIYGGTKGGAKVTSLNTVVAGDTVAIPSDPTNGARALLLLEQAGLITLKAGKGLDATVQDIVTKKVNFTIAELAAELVTTTLNVSGGNSSAAIAIVNGNYAIGAGLKIEEALETEDGTGEAASRFANVIAVNSGRENDAKIKALVEVLQTDEVKAFFLKEFGAGVKPAF